MGKKLTHEEFLKKLWEKNQYYRNGDFKVVGEFVDKYTTILIENKYGYLKVHPRCLFSNGQINSYQALDKEDYTLKELKDKNKAVFDKTLSVEIKGSKCLVQTIYGEVYIEKMSLFKNKDYSINTAVNKTEFWVERNRYIREDFNQIDYSLVNYISNSNKVHLRCKIHDYEYFQRPSHHTAGVQGCVYCMKQVIMYTSENIKKHKEFFDHHFSFLYVVHLSSETESFYKVGITAKDRFKYRLKALRKDYNVKVVYTQEGLTKDNFNLEQRFLREFKNYKYVPGIKFTGYTECLTTNPIDEYYDWFNNYYHE